MSDKRKILMCAGILLCISACTSKVVKSDPGGQLALQLKRANRSNEGQEARYQTKEADIEKLMEILSVSDLVVDEFAASLLMEMHTELSKNHDLSEDEEKELRDFVVAEIDQIYIDHRAEFAETMYGLNLLYNKTFTHAQIIDLIEFYKTKTGRVLVENSVPLAREGSLIGQKAGLFLLEKFRDRFKNSKRYPASLKIDPSAILRNEVCR